MSLWAQHVRPGAENDPNDPRAKVLRRFRGFALFWITILVVYFVGAGIIFEKMKSGDIDALPVFLLLACCILVGCVWHVGAIVVMSINGMFEKRPWDR
jgi:hypothetical protein